MPRFYLGASRAASHAFLEHPGVAHLVGQQQDQPGVEQLRLLLRQALRARRAAARRSRPHPASSVWSSCASSCRSRAPRALPTAWTSVRVHAFAGGGHIAVGPDQRPGMAEHVAGALQVALGVAHMFHGAGRLVGAQHLHAAQRRGFAPSARSRCRRRRSVSPNSSSSKRPSAQRSRSLTVPSRAVGPLERHVLHRLAAGRLAGTGARVGVGDGHAAGVDQLAREHMLPRQAQRRVAKQLLHARRPAAGSGRCGWSPARSAARPRAAPRDSCPAARARRGPSARRPASRPGCRRRRCRCCRRARRRG